MAPVLQSAFAQNIDGRLLGEADGGYQFVYKKTASGLAVASFRGRDSAVGSVRWVLGSGAQGQTPIVQSGRAFLESRISYFPYLDRYGITVGQSAAVSVSAAASLGRSKTSAELAQCLGCHSTVEDAQFTTVVPGVQCENCHPGARLHATGHGKAMNPGKLPPEQQVRLCGNCHRSSPPVDDSQFENVRFQPLRLMKSRCFVAGRIECTTCHVAHQDARRNDAAFYNSKCSGCHAGPRGHSDARSSGNCISCHMPQLQLHAALRFTDHFIRVVSPTDYPPDSIVHRSGD